MSTAAGVDTSTTNPDLRRKRAVRGAFWGFLVDSFDIYLPSIALLPAMIYFTQGLDMGQTALVTGFTLAATLFGRPVGAILFGHLSDRLGRKRVGAISIYGFGITTLAIACLPGAEQIGGVLAITLLLVLRFIDGIFLGGEYTAATPMAIEYAKPENRGFIGGFVQSASTIGYLAIAVFTFLALQISPAGDIDSPYVQWGWRIPFIIGAIFAYVVARYLRKDVEESVLWIESEKAKNPIREMLGRKHLASFIKVFILMTGVFFMVNMVGSVVPQLLLAREGFTATSLTLSVIFANIIVPFAYMLAGRLSDRFGRKPILIFAGCLGRSRQRHRDPVLRASGGRLLRAVRERVHDRHVAFLYQRAVPHAHPFVRLGYRLLTGRHHPRLLRALPGGSVQLHAAQPHSGRHHRFRRSSDHRERRDLT